jgi:hypothetical protein
MSVMIVRKVLVKNALRENYITVNIVLRIQWISNFTLNTV